MAKKPSKTNQVAKKSSKNIFKKRVSKQTAILTIALTVAVAAFVVSGAFWWSRIFMNPDKVFQSMLANNLSSRSVSRNVVQNDPSNGVDQSTYVSFSAPEVVSQSRTVLSQKNRDRSTTTVTTETIGTKNTDLVRYVSAEGAEGLSIAGNIQGILGVWASRQPDTGKGESATFLNEAVFSVVPFGNLTQSQRSQLIDYINQQDVYQYNPVAVKKSFKNGRYIYTYNVQLSPKAFVGLLAKYVEVTGIGDSSQLDPSAYESAGPINLKMDIDILSRQLIEIDYGSNGRSETYPSRNLYRDIKIPTETIPFDELQKRLTGATSAS